MRNPKKINVYTTISACSVKESTEISDFDLLKKVCKQTVILVRQILLSNPNFTLFDQK